MKDIHSSAFDGVPSSALTARLYEIRHHERALLVEFLRTLAEVDQRSVHVEMAFPSLFAFLTDWLGYTKSSAYRRSTAARLLARFPAAADYLADGRLNLTNFVELKSILDESRATEIFDRASGRTEDEVKQLVAAYAPREAPPDLLRRLPAPAPSAATPPAPAADPERPRLPARMEPISEELQVLRVTIGREFAADLAAARSALSHVIPGGDLVAVLHEGLRRVVRDHLRRTAGATERPRAARASRDDRRDPTAAVRREVWRRDGGRCAYRAPDGRVCGSTHRLQFHHIEPFAVGGAATVENTMLVCSVHNAHFADKDFGAEHMARMRRARLAPTTAVDPRQLSLV